MKYPKLKNALLCRILVYIVVLGGFIAPIIIVINLPFVPEPVKVLVGISLPIGLIVYLIKNFMVLMGMDMTLALLHCNNRGRKFFTLPKNFQVEKVEKRLSRFGKPYEPTGLSPRPHILQYKSEASMTIYAKGIEKVVATYHTDFLTKEQYQLFFRSGEANARALKGTKKHHFLDKEQKKSPLNCVTVIVIFAKRVEDGLNKNLLKIICQQAGDGHDTSILPCVVDLERGICTFDSEKIPYIGYQYAVKNRGIKMIRKYLFHNRFPYGTSTEMLDAIPDADTEQSLWSFWNFIRKEIIINEREMKKRFESMAHREVRWEENYVYVKWDKRGTYVPTETNEEQKTISIEPIDAWHYPKVNKMAKETIREIKKAISLHFARLGYSVEFRSED